MGKRLLAAWTLERSTGGWLETTANESGGPSEMAKNVLK